MTNYAPLYVGGKRDKARRYVNPSTGKIISQRQYIKLTEGVSPESKAYARYLVKPSGPSQIVWTRLWPELVV